MFKLAILHTMDTRTRLKILPVALKARSASLESAAAMHPRRINPAATSTGKNHQIQLLSSSNIPQIALRKDLPSTQTIAASESKRNSIHPCALRPSKQSARQTAEPETGSRSRRRKRAGDLFVMRKKMSPSLAWASAAAVISRMSAISSSAGSSGAGSDSIISIVDAGEEPSG